jgi:hypothetical protein
VPSLLIPREKNVGLMKNGKTWGEVSSYFVLGADETCLLASAGECHIIGDKMKKKHEINIGSDRVSITMLRTGSAAGETGPTIFFPAGTCRKPGYTDEFLVQNGAQEGSSIAMTDTGYMTDIGGEAFRSEFGGSLWRYVVNAMLARVAQHGTHSTQGYTASALLLHIC